jgi:indole-3-glycerol phosphate synthase
LSVLQEIVATTREQVDARKQTTPQAELAQQGAHRVSHGDLRPFADALRAPAAPGRVAVIAEHKRRSPSAGAIREDVPLDQVVGAYERGGAAALSVLTEPTRFGGQLGDLERARAAAGLPILRKDFVVDGYQVHEALAAGADAVLLIVAALAPDELHELHELATSLGLAALVEVHDATELQTATEIGARLIGINNRNLATLEVEIGTTYELLPQIPDGVISVAESGFSRPEELEQLAQAGADAVLIGEAMMRARDIEAACRDLSGAPAPLV